MIGVFIVGCSTPYLLPKFPIHMRETEDHLPSTTDAHSTPDNDHASGFVLPIRQLSVGNRWQNPPLLEPGSFNDVVESDEIKTPALQDAIERERDRADTARSQVIDLQQQLSSLKEVHEEKQEEVIVLREELGELRAKSLQFIEQQRGGIEKKSLDAAKSGKAVSDEELNSLRESVSEARKTADIEKMKATAALEQLEVVQGQLALLIAQEWGRKEDVSQLRFDEDQIVAAPSPETPKELLPANPAFQLPQVPEADKALSNRPGADTERDPRRERIQTATRESARPVSLHREEKTLVRVDDNASLAPARSRRIRPEAEAQGSSRIRPEARSQNVRKVEKASSRVSQRSRLIAQNVQSLRNPAALSLPSALRPDNRLW
jgi:TolA-binding protein